MNTTLFKSKGHKFGKKGHLLIFSRTKKLYLCSAVFVAVVLGLDCKDSKLYTTELSQFALIELNLT